MPEVTDFSRFLSAALAAAGYLRRASLLSAELKLQLEIRPFDVPFANVNIETRGRNVSARVL